MLTVNKAHSTVTMKLGERFDTSISQEFSDSFKTQPNDSQFIIDLSDTKYIDSSALGAMVALHHYVGPTGKKIKLTGIQTPVAAILKMASFDKLFDISA